jgi:TnpA family transposase
MPVQFLTDEERERLSQFPEQIEEEDIIAFFTLSTPDMKEIHKQRGEQNKLGYAIQLCALRFMGFSPDSATDSPPDVIKYVAKQLHLNPESLSGYGRRAPTRTAHFQRVRQYLGFRKADADYLQFLSEWIVDRALEHENPLLLLNLSCDKLIKDKIVRPGITRLERLVATAINKANKKTFNQVKPLLTKDRRSFLDLLLIPDSSTRKTQLAWLRKRAISNSAREILAAIKKLHFLKDQGVARWDLSFLNPNRQKTLAQIGRRATNQYLQRQSNERRYPILIAFLRQTLIDVTDEIIEMFIQALWDFYQDGKKDLQSYQQSVADARNEKVILFQRLGSVILDSDIKDVDVRSATFCQISKVQLERAMKEADKIMKPHGDSVIEFFGNRYSHIRQFSSAFLEAFEFKSLSSINSILKAIALLKRLDEGQGRKPIPRNAPTRFITKPWRPYVFGSSDGSISRRYYELCALWELRNAILSSNIWIEGSRKYAHIDSYFIPRDIWRKMKSEACAMTGAPEDCRKRLKERKQELEKLICSVNRLLDTNENQAGIRLQKKRVIVSPLNAEDIPESAAALKNMINRMLPKVDLADILIEVDGWIHFSDCFEHQTNVQPRTKTLLLHIYASIMAQACNFGLHQMEDITGVSYRKLAWCTTWYIRDETLKAANTRVVNYQHRLPLSKRWGGGTLSSSDGQRLPVSVKTRTARPLPKYFGYGSGLTYYTWTSDQLSQYGIKVLPATTRDAPFVLDEIYGNETELEIGEHTVDTAGQTEKIFGIFDISGLLFSPRIKDIGVQSLYRFRSISTREYKNLKNRFKGIINEKRIVEMWDDLLRMEASFRFGWVTASLVLQKLEALPKNNELARALLEYGRIPKTIHILRWYESETRRRRINKQLNKGEAVHSLRDYIHHANKGKIRRKYYDEQQNQAACLNLVTNIVITWYTVYIAYTIEQLKAEGYPVNDEDVSYQWPTKFAGINVHGKINFNIDEELKRKRLRPLRKPEGD